MYRALEKKVLADEEERKQKERQRRVSMGLPAEEGKQSHPASPQKCRGQDHVLWMLCEGYRCSQAIDLRIV